MWHFGTSHYRQMAEASKSNFVLPRLALYVCSAFTSLEDEESVRSFFNGVDTAKYSLSVDQGLESIRAQRLWLERDTHQVSAWLRAHEYLA